MLENKAMADKEQKQSAYKIYRPLDEVVNILFSWVGCQLNPEIVKPTAEQRK